MQNYNETALSFIQANPNSTKNAIGDHLQLRGLPLFNLLKAMVKDGQIIANLNGPDTTYTIIVSSQGGSAEPSVPTTEKTKTETGLEEATKDQTNETIETNEDKKVETADEVKEEATEATAKKPEGRNTGTLMFNGVSYNKGKLIHAIVLDYVSKNSKITHDKLKEVFPDTLMKRFGIFQTVEKAREISGSKYDRYFFKDEMQIKLKDAIIVTTNQITCENLLPFLSVARKQLGYDIATE